MGGHGVFVWSCYGIVIVALAANIFQPIQAARKFRQMQKRVISQQSQQARSGDKVDGSSTTTVLSEGG